MMNYRCKCGHSTAQASAEAEPDETEARIRRHYPSSTDWEWLKNLLGIIDRLRAQPVTHLYQLAPVPREEARRAAEFNGVIQFLEHTAEIFSGSVHGRKADQYAKILARLSGEAPSLPQSVSLSEPSK